MRRTVTAVLAFCVSGVCTSQLKLTAAVVAVAALSHATSASAATYTNPVLDGASVTPCFPRCLVRLGPFDWTVQIPVALPPHRCVRCLPADVPDPGVLYDPATKLYWAGTTGGNSVGRFPLHSSPDLATWTDQGAIFPNAAGTWPKWAGTGTMFMARRVD